MNSARRRIAEEREPVVDGCPRQARVGRGPFMTPPAPGAQIVIGAEKLEEILCHTLVDIEIGTKRRIEALNGAGGAVAFVQEPLLTVSSSVSVLEPSSD